MRSRPYRLRGKPKPGPNSKRPLDGTVGNSAGNDLRGSNAAKDHVTDRVSTGGGAGLRDEPAHDPASVVPPALRRKASDGTTPSVAALTRSSRSTVAFCSPFIKR